jgi:periplasmic protein TonB
VIQKRKVRNSSNVNLIVSAAFHGALILAIVFFAAREGLIGKRMKQLAVTMVPKEKKPEPPKEKPPEPKLEPPKTPDPRQMNLPPPPAETPTAAPPPPAAVSVAPAEAAPAAVSLPSFEFSDGAKEVSSISDPNSMYRALVEHAFRDHWNRPEDVADDKYVADAEVSVTPAGEVAQCRLVSGSGDKRWDASVKEALDETKRISRPPPKGFPGRFNIRFDVEVVEAAPASPLGIQ